MLSDRAVNRQDIARQNLQLEREKMQWEMAQSLIGPGSNASAEERDVLSTLLRKRLMESLKSGEALSPRKEIRLSPERRNAGNVTRLFNVDGSQMLLNASNVCSDTCVESIEPDISMSVSGNLYAGQTPSSYQRAVERN